jgi:hypothetical protein
MTPMPPKITFELAHTGRLPLWAALLVGILVFGLCLLIARAEARRLRRRKGAKWLAVTRSLVVLALAWLLVQPILFIRKETTESGRLLVLVDDSKSMFLKDAYKRLGSQLDLAQLLRLPGTGERSSAFADCAAAMEEHERKLAQSLVTARGFLDELEQGLPWGESFTSAVLKQAEEARTRAAWAAERTTELERLLVLLSTGGEETEAEKRRQLFRPVQDYATACQQASERLGEWGKKPDKTAEALSELIREQTRLMELTAPAAQSLKALQDEADARVLASGPPELAKSLSAIQEMSRFDLAVAALKDSGLLAELSGKHELDVRRLKDLEPLMAEARAALRALTPQDAQPVTDFYEPLDKALQELSLDLLSGIILVTDGQQNSRERPEVLQRLVKQRIPFLAVGVGSTEPASDMAIADYRFPGVVVAGKKADFEVVLKAAVPPGTRYQFLLQDGKDELAKVESEAAQPGTVPVTSAFTLDKEGKRTLKLAVRWDGPDANPENNEIFLPVSALDRKAKVLVIAATARWDIAYLLHALEKEPCTVDLVLTGEKKAKPERGKGKGKIPDTLAEMKSYGLVVLDGEPFSGVTERDAELLGDYVEQAGGCLLLLHGTGSGKPSYPRLLASRFPTLGEAAGPGKASDGEHSLRVVEKSRLMPVALLAAESEESRGRWAQLAEPQFLSPVSAQTVPLVEAPVLDAPVFSLGFYGKGRIYQLGIGDIFRMREWHGADAVDQLFASLAQDALRPLFEGQDSGLLVATDPPLPSVGQVSQVLVHLGEPEPKSVFAALELPGNESREVKLARAAQKARLWQGEFTPSRPGPFRVSVNADSARKEHDVSAASPLSKESVYFHLDEAVLEKMASKANGTYVHLSRAETVIRALPARTRPKVTVTEVKLWDRKLILLLAAGLLTLDWVIRRKKGIIL